jgi:hypothetical protein
MHCLIRGTVIGALFAVGSLTVAAAADPVGGCSPGFELHAAMHHEGDHMHPHVGTDADQNGDGWICVKHLDTPNAIHVHIDNNVQRP